MGKRTKKKPHRKPAAPSGKKKFPVGMASLLALAAVVSGLWLIRPHLESTPEPGFQKLVGRWLRPDGGYILEIKSVNSEGKMEAAYFNPRPIHVAMAKTFRDGAAINAFIELRDVNYPGSTYTLRYDSASDRLSGIYFQAAIRQQFEVEFIRKQ